MNQGNFLDSLFMILDSFAAMLTIGEKQLFAPPDGFDSLDSARFVVVSVPIEATVSYGGGTAKGPEAIIAASQQVELFDVDETNEPYRQGISTLEVPALMTDAHKAVEYGKEITKEILSLGKIPVVLGGEHSLSAGIAQALAEQYDDFSVLHFDAHSDLRDTYHGDIYSHASALRRLTDIPQMKKLVQVGIRNVSNDPADGSEYDFIQANTDRIRVYYAKDMPAWDLDEMIEFLGERVYLTFDVDALDPSIMPATGTPEPGGMDWYTTLAILKRACSTRTIIGMDVVEFAPIPNFHAPAFLVAKLLYKTIGFMR